MTKGEQGRASLNRAFYDADSDTYDASRWDTKGGAFTNRVQQQILETLCGDWINQEVLEVGVGTARFTLPLLRKENRLTLADVSANMLSVARRKIEEAGLSKGVAAYRESSIYELPFDDATFDHVICINVLNHLDRPQQAIEELSRVLRPASTILFNYANLHSYYWPAAKRVNRRRAAIGQDVYSVWQRPADVRSMISKAGLELLLVLGHVHVPRGLEKYGLRPLAPLLDSISRRGPLRRFAPLHFCLCRKI